MIETSHRPSPDNEPSWTPAPAPTRASLAELCAAGASLDPRWQVHGNGVSVAAFNSSI